jgi:Xaa-Pro aminopeptidase
MDLKAIQSALRARNFDAWLFYDHHHRDPIAYGVLGLPEKLHVTRRWYYLIPAEGDPVKLVHRIEAYHLDPLPGAKHEYSAWQEQHEQLKSMLAPYKTVAMQYSPNNLIPYISLVDGGTIELVRSFGKEIVSSGDLVSQFEATWSEEQIASHFAARDAIDGIVRAAFKEIGSRVRNGGTTEYEIQKFIHQAFERENIITDSPVIVAVNANSGNPHYGPSQDKPVPIRKGDFVLLDVWGKKNTPNSVFYDITWTGVVDATPTSRQQEIFRIVRDARDAGFRKVEAAFSSGQRIAGWEVDKATRDGITSAGYGKYFTHRTGHSIGVEIHANGANMDNLETKDEREIIPNTCFSIEPGIYLPEFGVRSEFDVLIHNGKAEITGKIQNELVLI